MTCQIGAKLTDLDDDCAEKLSIEFLATLYHVPTGCLNRFINSCTTPSLISSVLEITTIIKLLKFTI